MEWALLVLVRRSSSLHASPNVIYFLACTRDIPPSAVEAESSEVCVVSAEALSILKPSIHRLRKSTGDERYWAPLDQRQESLLYAIMMSCYVPFSEYHYLEKLESLL